MTPSPFEGYHRAMTLSPDALAAEIARLNIRPEQLAPVDQVLASVAPGARLQFSLNRRGSLGGLTPLEALAAGRLSKVLDLAAAFVEQ
jgi:hypothetical protein